MHREHKEGSPPKESGLKVPMVLGRKSGGQRGCLKRTVRPRGELSRESGLKERVSKRRQTGRAGWSPSEEGREAKPTQPSRLAVRLLLVWYKQPTEAA